LKIQPIQVLIQYITVIILITAINKTQGQTLSKNCSKSDSLQWVATSIGCLHYYTFKGDSISAQPNLVIVLHGDAPFNNPGYQYSMAKQVASKNKNSIAIGLLRPGYMDPDGNTSDGKRGLTTGDNYTLEIMEAIEDAIGYFKMIYQPANTILVGHSGGAAITADIIALKPGLIDKAVIVSCPCDLGLWRKYMSQQQPNVPQWKDSVGSISPISVVNKISKNTEVVVITGEKDDVAPTELSTKFYDALKSNGVHSTLIRIPNEGHEILLNDSVFSAIKTLLIQ
jgi:pimeloyl-ACP methyl ester carboxylesterase